MNNPSYQIAYCAENTEKAQGLKKLLEKKGIEVALSSCEQAAEQQQNLGQFLVRKQSIVLLLISDNFLKSEDCLLNLLPSVRQLDQQKKLYPIITKGWVKKADGPKHEVNTEFDRVSQVIKYMNYWSDIYLEVRQNKRVTTSGGRTKDLNERLKDIRSISAEVGELLRYLRNINCYDYEKLISENGAGLYKLLRIEHQATTTLVGSDTNTATTNSENNNSTTTIAAKPPKKVGPAEINSTEDLPEKTLETEAKDETNSLYDIFDEVNTEVQAEQAESESIEELPTAKEELPQQEKQKESKPIQQVEPPAPEPVLSENQASSTMTVEDLLDDVDIDDTAKSAEPVIERAAEKKSDEMTQGSQTAAFLIEAGEIEQGIKLLRTLLKNRPEHSPTRYQLAHFLFHQQQKNEKAKKELEILIQHEAAFLPAYTLLAEIDESSENKEGALYWLKKATEANADPYGELSYQMGMLMLHCHPDRRTDSLDYFRKAISHNPQHADAYYRYASLLAEDGQQIDEAIQYFKKTLKLDPQHPFANYDLALIYHQQKDWERAPLFYKRAIEVNAELQTEQNDEAFGVHLTPLQRRKREAAELLPIFMPLEHDQVVWITGATSGIGLATAKVFAQAGYKLILSGRREERLEELSKELTARYEVSTEVLSFDVRDPEAVKQAIDSLSEPFAEVDILINNAGLAKGLSPIHEGDWAHWETMIDTNIKGLLLMTRLVSAQMVKRKRGHIVNVGSIAGKEVYHQGNVYCATKHAVDALTRAMRLDLHPYGIRVSQVSPGHVENTEFALTRFDGDAERAKIYEQFNPLRARDVAETIYFLATRPAHVNIQDVLMMGTQQANASTIDRSGRAYDEK